MSAYSLGYLAVLSAALVWQIKRGIAFGWVGRFPFKREDAPVAFWIAIAIEIAFVVAIAVVLLKANAPG